MDESIALSLINQISGDLGIVFSEKIPVDKYYSMVVYSALGEWVKRLAYDKREDRNDFETGENIPASKHHITLKLKKILDSFLAEFPEIKKWFYPENSDILPYSGSGSSDPITEIRRRLIDAGILVSGKNNTLQCPRVSCVAVSSDKYLFRGPLKLPTDQVVGLGSYCYGALNHQVTIDDMFNLPQTTADVFVNQYCQSIKSKLIASTNPPQQREYFNPFLKRSIYNSWDREYDERCFLTIYRDTLQDYGIIVNNNGKQSTFSFPKSFVSMNETRRFCYGIWAKEQIPVVARVKMLDELYCLIHLPSFLPKKEQTVLYQFAWPYNNYCEGPEYITTKEFLPIIDNLFKKLCIQVTYV